MKKILLLEDNANLRSLIRQGLEEAGYAVTEAPDGKVGLKLCAQIPFDLVLTDIVMPETDGLEFIFTLRKTNPGARIIAMSGGGLVKAEEYLKVAGLAGAAFVLPKPFKLVALFALIQKALEESPAGSLAP
ncbi:MAG: response regulator [Verrucomicrobiota bacterium]